MHAPTRRPRFGPVPVRPCRPRCRWQTRTARTPPIPRSRSCGAGRSSGRHVRRGSGSRSRRASHGDLRRVYAAQLDPAIQPCLGHTLPPTTTRVPRAGRRYGPSAIGTAHNAAAQTYGTDTPRSGTSAVNMASRRRESDVLEALDDVRVTLEVLVKHLGLEKDVERAIAARRLRAEQARMEIERSLGHGISPAVDPRR